MRAFRVFDRSYTVTQSRWLSHLLTFGVILVATGLVAGCMKVNTLVRVEPDGTGVIEERTVLSKRLVLMMREMGKRTVGRRETGGRLQHCGRRTATGQSG